MQTARFFGSVRTTVRNDETQTLRLAAQQEMIVTDPEIQINGMAHVILCVSDFGAARKFYERLLPALGMTPVCDTDKLFYTICCVRWAPPSSMRRRTAHGHLAITRCCSKTLMAFVWKLILFRVLACSPLA